MTLIQNKVNTVFIPVKDVYKAKEWYSKNLGKEGEIIHGHLCILDMEGTGVVLDEMPAWRNEVGEFIPFSAPYVQFTTSDIHASYLYLKENGVELVTGIEHGHYFVFKDLDGNMLMVCQ
ncbi:VOC family protein [Ornithinibacillus sp. 179-J 7C1 HS]|uniref:VOC family protein n=1 Tax=Ornithinibacillus sp. 179-J 7C1 HS TaxID=3142384 RepID=UPI00399F519C